MNQYKKIAECLGSAHHLVIFSGAGMSTSSGLPDFRSSQGLWSRYNPMALASIDAMENNREAFLDFYRFLEVLITKPFVPNKVNGAERKGINTRYIISSIDNSLLISW